MKKMLSSGAELDVTLSSFGISHALFKAVLKEMGKVKISIGLGERSLQDLIKMETSDEAINTLKDIVVSLLSSGDIEAAVWGCMQKATYNGQRINEKTFEPEDARGDYPEVVKEVMLVNLTPFFKGLVSQLSELRQGGTMSTPKLSAK